MALKLLLSPALVGSATWIQQRWGHAIGGRVIGLPLTTGPFLLIVGLQEGREYASTAAHGVIAGQFALALFTTVYAHLVRRFPWYLSLGLATGVQVSVTLVVSRLSVPIALLVPAIFLIIVLALKTWPAYEESASIEHPRWELPARIVTAVALIVTLSGLASVLGPTLAGALASYPVIISVLGAFTQKRYGPNGVLNTLRGLMQSLPVSVAILAVIASLL